MNTQSFKIVPFRFFGEPQKRFAVVIDGRMAALLPRRMAPIRTHVAPFVEALRGGRVTQMATILPSGKWSAFESGRL